MTASTTKSKLKACTAITVSILVWLIAWEISARIVDIRFIYPAFSDVVVALVSGIVTAQFWISVAMSLLRIGLGFMLGTLLAVSLALLSRYHVIYYLIKPIVTVARCTPVASFIVILWLMLRSSYIPTLIAVLMVFPVVWEGAYRVVAHPPKELNEVCLVFGLSARKRLFCFTLPTLLKSTLPSIITASGLAWKAGVAAEIITYTKNSIGRHISEARGLLEGADMLAWTSVVVLLSIAVEYVIKHYTKKVEKIWEY